MTFLAIVSSSLTPIFPRRLSTVLSKFSHENNIIRVSSPCMVSPRRSAPAP